jgi:hypothetical protein
MRTIIAGFFALAAVASLTACNDSNPDRQDSLSNQAAIATDPDGEQTDVPPSMSEEEARGVADDMHNQMDGDEHNRMTNDRGHRGSGMRQQAETTKDRRM